MKVTKRKIQQHVKRHLSAVIQTIYESEFMNEIDNHYLYIDGTVINLSDEEFEYFILYVKQLCSRISRTL